MFPVPFGSLKIGAHEGRRASSVGLFKQSLFPWRPPFPFIVLLYGSRARNAYSVTCSVLKRNKTKQKKKQHQPGRTYCICLNKFMCSFETKCTCLLVKSVVRNGDRNATQLRRVSMLLLFCFFHVDVNRLPRFTSAAAPPLPGIQLHATVIFFFLSWRLQEISPFRSLVFLEIMPSPARGVLVRLSVSRRVSRANFCIPLSQMLSAAYVYTDFEQVD